jgi:hypothetical protein
MSLKYFFFLAAPNIRSDLVLCEICHVAVHDLQNLVAENATQVSELMLC